MHFRTRWQNAARPRRERRHLGSAARGSIPPVPHRGSRVLNQSMRLSNKCGVTLNLRRMDRPHRNEYFAKQTWVARSHGGLSGCYSKEERHVDINARFTSGTTRSHARGSGRDRSPDARRLFPSLGRAAAGRAQRAGCSSRRDRPCDASLDRASRRAPTIRGLAPGAARQVTRTGYRHAPGRSFDFPTSVQPDRRHSPLGSRSGDGGGDVPRAEEGDLRSLSTGAALHARTWPEMAREARRRKAAQVLRIYPQGS
jgi:hypothetical protein